MNDYASMFNWHDDKRDQRLKNGVYLADILWRYVQPSSVIDLGCGLGFFLAACADKGAEVHGVDADWVEPLKTEIPKDNYTLHDLNAPYTSEKRYDLAASIECAEHLKPERSRDLVDELCALSDVVLFSSAIPGQGGSGHINLRWQTFWARLFAAKGYRCYDPIRRKMAGHKDAFYWFSQNTLLYVKDGFPVSEALKEHEISPEAASYVARSLYSRRVNGFRKKLEEQQSQ